MANKETNSHTDSAITFIQAPP